MDTRVCTKCDNEKALLEFSSGKSRCKECRNEDSKAFYTKNKDTILSKRDPEKVQSNNRQYYDSHKDEIIAQKREYNARTKEIRSEKRKKHYLENKEEIAASKSAYKKKNRKQINEKERKKRQSEPTYRLMESVRSSIKSTIKRCGGKKNGVSSLQHLPYNGEDLLRHIGAQFESWMNWDNQGIYDPKTWDDNDSSTWKWQLDHIIPKSDLPFESLEEDNFKKCWGLENLRPYSAKQNIIDGPSRTRHKRGS